MSVLAIYGGYVPVLILALISLVIGGAALLISHILGPKRPTRTKELPYECGMEPLMSARQRYPVHFYLVAILFILFDLEAVFLFPWAASFADEVTSQAVKVVLLVEVLAFIVVLGLGLVYVWKRRGLEWD